MLVAVSLLAISLSFLLYHHPPSTWPSFFAGAEDNVGHVKPNKSQEREDPPRARDEQRHSEPQSEANREPEKLERTEASPQTTPKAVSQNTNNAPAVPTFTLDAHQSSYESSDDDDDLPPPSFPALNSAQRASAPPPSFTMSPPAAPRPMAPPSKPATSSLMPPPRVAPSNLRALPISPKSMRVPTTGPLPNRGPIPNRGPPTSNSSLGPPPSAGPTLKTPNARGKVLLSPGHSPLDWATLLKSGTNLSGVQSLMRVTPSMLKEKNGRKGRPAWSSYQGKVYNISPYLPFHPGGEGELKRAAGKDGTKLFMEVHPWVNWENMMGECMVGIMVAEEQASVQLRSSLEDMD
jgi:cytochrome b involved in lipid metabolism